MGDKTTRLTFELFGRDQASPVFDKFGRKVKDVDRDVGGLTGTTKKLIGAAAGYVAFDTAANFLRDANEEAREAQKVGALTANAIKVTGGAANVTADQVGDLATQISLKTGVDDEQIQSSSNLLLTFKQVRNELGEGNKVFDRATKAAVDLSAAGFGSAEGSAKMLGKALNDPIKGISALGRAGVTFTQQQKDQIKSYVEQNDLLSAQKMILGEVETQVGGAAAASATAGEKAAVAWGNVKEEIGTALLPIIDEASERFVDFVDKNDIGGWAETAADGISDFGREVGPVAKELLPVLATGLEATGTALSSVAGPLKVIVDAFNSLPAEAQTAILVGGGAAALGRRGLPLLGPAAGPRKPRPGSPDSKDRDADRSRSPKGSPAGVGALGTLGSLLGLGSDNKFAQGLGFTAMLTGNPYLAAASAVGGAGSFYNQRLLDSVAKPGDKPLTNKDTSDASVKIFGEDLDRNRQKLEETERQSAATRLALIQMLTDPSATAADFATELDVLGDKKPRPNVDIKGAPRALEQLDEADRRLDDVDSKDARPGVRPEGLFSTLTNLGRAGDRLVELSGMSARPSVEVTGLFSALGAARQLGDELASIAQQNIRRGDDVGNAARAPGRSTGGPVFGPGTGTSDDVLLWGSNGEHMLSTADVHAMGGHAGVLAFRRGLHGAPAYARGGPIGDKAAAPATSALTEAGIARALLSALQGATFRTDTQGNMRLLALGG